MTFEIYPEDGGAGGYTASVLHVETLELVALDAYSNQLVVSVDSTPLPPIEPTPAAQVTLPAAPSDADRIVLVATGSTPLEASAGVGWTVDLVASITATPGARAIELVADTESNTWRQVVPLGPIFVSSRFTGNFDTDGDPPPWLLPLEDPPAQFGGGVYCDAGTIFFAGGFSAGQWEATIVYTSPPQAERTWSFTMREGAGGIVDGSAVDVTTNSASTVSRTTVFTWLAAEGDTYAIYVDGETLVGAFPADVRISLRKL